MDPLDQPNIQGPRDRMPGAPKDRSLTHLGRQFDRVLGGGRTGGLPDAYHLSSHWDDVDSFDERQPMRRNHGMREGGSGIDERWGAKRQDYFGGTRPLEGMDVVKPLAQRYGMGWRHAIAPNPN